MLIPSQDHVSRYGSLHQETRPVITVEISVDTLIMPTGMLS